MARKRALEWHEIIHGTGKATMPQPTPYPSTVEWAKIQLKRIDAEIRRLEKEREKIKERLHGDGSSVG